jgi:hypothetical protein
MDNARITELSIIHYPLSIKIIHYPLKKHNQ